MMRHRCPACGKRCRWVEDAWVCTGCGDEWYPPDIAGVFADLYEQVTTLQERIDAIESRPSSWRDSYRAPEALSANDGLETP